MKGDYFDLGSILEDQDVVPTIMNMDIECQARFGFEEIGFQKESKVEIPLWLARTMAIFEFGVLDAKELKIYPCLKRLNADPSTFFGMNQFYHQFFYEKCLILKDLIEEIEEEEINIPTSLESSFSKRLENIFKMSECLVDKDYNLYVNSLSFAEKKLFLSSYQSFQLFSEWKKRIAPTIQSYSDHKQNNDKQNKRKRDTPEKEKSQKKTRNKEK